MKHKLPSVVRNILVLIYAWVTTQAAVAQMAPVLVTQPADQTVEYGTNVSFTVIANGTPLIYQWHKDGEDLRDYNNVAGAQTATLTLVGVGHNDAAGYSVIVSNAAGVVTSVVATLTVKSTVVFKEDFEAGMANWIPFSETNSLVGSSVRNHTQGGSLSAVITNSQQRMYHNLGVELGGRVNATFWMFDRSNGQSRAYGELRGYTGLGHTNYIPRGGLQQSFSIGRYDSKFGTNNTGALAGENVKLTKYQGRVMKGTNAGWFNLDAPGSPNRSTGWHKFEIRRSANGQTVRFYVDGILGKTVTGATHTFLDSVAIGSVGSGSSTGSTYFDDITVEAFPRKFDWQSKDSTGKGLFDWMKLHETGTNEVVTDSGQVITIFQTLGANTTARLGNWQPDGTGIHALDMRGYVEYSLTAPTDDAYRIEVEGREQGYKYPAVDLPLEISIDGERLGRFNLTYGSQSSGVVRCFTPFLRAGTHKVRVYWDNASGHCSLRVDAVRLQSLTGSDLNANGFKDWMENRLYAQCGIDELPPTSFVSPVCIEGRGQYLSMMNLAAGIQAMPSPIQIQRGAGRHWYADVPLNPSAGTRVEISYQNGGLVETREIFWQETNLLEANNMTIRKGDSLLLTAFPTGAAAGEVRITVVGVTNYVTDVSTPVAHQFGQAGTFTVRGRYLPTGAVRAITVKVIEASIDPLVATWADKRRYLDCTNLPPSVVLDADPRLKTALFFPKILGTNGRQVSLVNDEAVSRAIVARLGRKGPILASSAVEGFRLFGSADTYLRQMAVYPDGSQLIEAAFILSPVLPQLSVELHILVSGVTFDDGTITKVLTSADFDTLGICRVRFLRAAGVATSVCHSTKVYQNGVLVGWPSNPK